MSDEFLLPESDLKFLEDKGYKYSLNKRSDYIDLIIEDFSFSQYNPEKASILLQIPPGYPNTAMDMYWTYPDIRKKDGSWPQACEHHEEFHGKSWQRWSRHGEWRSGIDNLRTYIARVITDIKRGI